MSALPTMPEPAIRHEGGPIQNRSSEEQERRRLLHNSYQSTATTVPSILKRPSQESTPTGAESPSRQQLTTWGGPSINHHLAETSHPEPIRISTDNRPPEPATYGRSTSQDYTVYEPGAGTPTPQPPQSSYSHHNDHAMTYRGDEAYFQRPYRRAGPAPSIRDTTETSSLKHGGGGRYTPLQNQHQHTPKKSVSLNPNPMGIYESDENTPDPETTPPRPAPPTFNRPQQRRGTSWYIVREGATSGGYYDGDGTPPPDGWYQLQLGGWLKGPIRNHFVAVLGEFVGTTLFLFFAFAGTLVANIGAQESKDNTTTNETVGYSPIVNLYVAVAFGFSLMVNVWIFFRVSGGLFNPAVTLGMVMTRTINYIRGFLLVGAQLCGAIFASFLVQVMFPYEFNVRTTLSSSTSVTRGVFIEALLTAELVFTVFMLAKEKHKATYMAPVGIGLALFVAELVGVFFTGGSLNPARSFGPCVTTGQFDPEHWIYWVGPALGAIAAVAFYNFIKILEYEMANPGQDHSAEEAEAASLEGRKRRGTVGGGRGGGEREKEMV